MSRCSTPARLLLRAATLRGEPARTNARHISCCGSLLEKRAGPAPRLPSPRHASSSGSNPRRSFINLAAPVSRGRMEYSETRTLGFTPEQVYSVVACVDQYQHFVPWCKKSRMMRGKSGKVLAELQIGFPPLLERYTSQITVVPNHQVRAVCTDGALFRHLETMWRFSPGPEDQPNSCKVDFYVSFEFRSLLHSQLASLFFDEVVKQMVSAFESRTAFIYNGQQEATSTRQAI